MPSPRPHRSLFAALLAILAIVVSGCATIDSADPAAPDPTVEASASESTGDADAAASDGSDASASESEPDESAAPEPTDAPQLDADAEDSAAAEAADSDAADSDADDSDAGSSDTGSSDTASSDTDNEPIQAPAPVPLVLPDFVTLAPNLCLYDELIPVPVSPECLALTVPEDWDNPDPDDLVVLQIAVFAASGAEPAETPMVYLEGGPGGHSLDNLQFAFDGLVAPHLEDRSVIVFDQRGAGLAEPSLFCDESVEASLATSAVADPYEDEAAVRIDALVQCRDRLVADGVNLTRYNSISSANDVEALRQMLGHDQLDLLGISYGTRLAQTIMRMYPDSVRSVVLDSVVPTGAELFSDLPVNAEQAFGRLFDSCAADAACDEAFPDLEDRYFAMVEQLDDDPVELTVRDPFTLAESTAIVSGADLISGTFQSLYNRQIFGSIPKLIADFETGDYAIMESLAAQALVQLDSLSYGMLLSVQCNEDLPFDDRSNLAANTSAEPGYSRFAVDLSAEELFDSCDEWPSGTAPAFEDELVISDIPTLLLGGAFDPITPIEGLDTIAEGLSTSWSVVFPNEGHGIAPTPCGAEIVRAFFAAPAEEPDASCVAAAPKPVYTPGTGGPVTLVEFEASFGAQNIQGVRPEGWITQGAGVFARTENIDDPTLMLVQSVLGVPVGLLQSLLADSLSDAVGESFTFTEAEPRQTDNNIWDAFEATAADQEIRLYVNESLFVVVITRSSEFDTLDAELIGPFLNEIELT